MEIDDYFLVKVAQHPIQLAQKTKVGARSVPRWIVEEDAKFWSEYHLLLENIDADEVLPSLQLFYIFEYVYSMLKARFPDTPDMPDDVYVFFLSTEQELTRLTNIALDFLRVAYEVWWGLHLFVDFFYLRLFLFYVDFDKSQNFTFKIVKGYFSLTPKVLFVTPQGEYEITEVGTVKENVEKLYFSLSDFVNAINMVSVFREVYSDSRYHAQRYLKSLERTNPGTITVSAPDIYRDTKYFNLHHAAYQEMVKFPNSEFSQYNVGEYPALVRIWKTYQEYFSDGRYKTKSLMEKIANISITLNVAHASGGMYSYLGVFQYGHGNVRLRDLDRLTTLGDRLPKGDTLPVLKDIILNWRRYL